MATAPSLREVSPMLLDERPVPFDVRGWVYEIKFDGYRLLAQGGDGAAALQSRNGADATRWFPEVAKALASLPGGPHILDGEVCVLDDQGRSDFDRLHARAKRRRWYPGADDVVFCVFDLLVLNGVSVMRQPLLKRKVRLAELVPPDTASLLLVGHFDHGAETIFRDAVIPLGLEGLVAKRAASPYQPGVRSADWVKIKRKGAVPPERFKRSPRP